jgi:hypothetical protein
MSFSLRPVLSSLSQNTFLANFNIGALYIRKCLPILMTLRCTKIMLPLSLQLDWPCPKDDLGEIAFLSQGTSGE